MSACYFYHFYDLPNGLTVGGPAPAYDLRGQFESYIGGVDLRRKTVFDFGTASGFLAISAEQAGAKSVTAFDVARPFDQQRVPFKKDLYHTDKRAWSRALSTSFKEMHNSFWHARSAYGSSVEMVYGRAEDLAETSERFDVVIAGAVIEHLSDPVTTIGLLARLARETLIIAFTPVLPNDEELMRPMIPWADAEQAYAWWCLSAGLYRRVLGNLGFAIDFQPVTATLVQNGSRVDIPRMTIVANRI